MHTIPGCRSVLLMVLLVLCVGSSQLKAPHCAAVCAAVPDESGVLLIPVGLISDGGGSRDVRVFSDSACLMSIA